METMNLKQLVHGISIKAVRGAHLNASECDDWQLKANDWRITLRYKGRSYSFDYWQGVGIKKDPQIETVMDNLLSNTLVDRIAFEDWVSEYGYSSDSRKAERIYKACVKQTKAVKRLLGNDYEQFLESERD